MTPFQACMAFHDHTLTAAQFYNWLIAHHYWGTMLRLGQWTFFVNLCGGA